MPTPGLRRVVLVTGVLALVACSSDPAAPAAPANETDDSVSQPTPATVESLMAAVENEPSWLPLASAAE